MSNISTRAKERLINLSASYFGAGCYLTIGLFIFLAYTMILVKFASDEINKTLEQFIVTTISRKIVTLDIKDVVTEFLEKQKAKSLASNEIDELAGVFSEKLESIIDKKASTEGLIIIPKQAVVAGSRDITTELKAELFKGLV